MEPKAASPESLPTGEPRNHEHVAPEERSFEQPSLTPERERPAGEHEPQPVAAQPAQPVPITLPTPVVPDADDASAASSTDDLPSVAGDDDLIEKEWVDKAKQIIADTRDDPHRREKEVGRLQADYLRKRYGKELGSSEA